MRTVHILLEQVYHHLGNVREVREQLTSVLPCTEPEPQITMTGGLKAYSGIDDWAFTLNFTNDVTEHDLDHAVATLPLTHGVTYHL